MQSESETANRLVNLHSIRPSSICSEPWWRTGFNSSSVEHINDGVGPKDSQSQSNGAPVDSAVKEPQTILSPRSGSDGNYGHNHPILQPQQFELVGHSVACASNPYSDPYYGGMMAAYGPQPLVHPQLIGVHHARMPLPIEVAQEPVYVNAKQYHGILRRRQSRAKAELEKKLIKNRKPYLHESRHQHALRRARGSGGRFAKKADNDSSKHTAEEKLANSGPALSSQSASSSGSEPFPTDSGGEATGPHQVNRHEAQKFNHYQNHNGFQGSLYPLQLGERGEKADCSGQQWGSIPSDNRTPKRALAI